MTEHEHGPVELRTAPVDRVDYPARTIELIAVPYDQPATVEYQNRLIEESFVPGAFGDVHKRAAHRRMAVNLEHDRDQWVGRVVALDTRSTDGLRASLLIRRGPVFDQVLDDAADGMYAASVGFAVGPRGQQWEGRSRRRIVTAFLDHIALTMTPAYAGTDVLAVRTAPEIERSSTPNLDRVLAERAARA
jgi:HK97 family phage prohead protease